MMEIVRWLFLLLLLRSSLGQSTGSASLLAKFDRELQRLVSEATESHTPSTAPTPLLLELGNLYWERDSRWQQGGSFESLRYFAQANAQTPPDLVREKFALTLRVGILQTSLGMLPEAKKSLSLALEVPLLTSSERASALYHLGVALLVDGDENEAHAHFQESLLEEPCGSEAQDARLFLALTVKARRELRSLIRQLESSPSSSCGDESLRQRALFSAQDALGSSANRTKAWAHLTSALSLAAASTSSANAYSYKASAAEAKFVADRNRGGFWWLSSSDLVGLDTRQPVFIVGFPRSGSTLLESMLAAHPSVRVLGETTILPMHVEELEAELQRRRGGKSEAEFRDIIAKHAGRLLHAMQSAAAAPETASGDVAAAAASPSASAFRIVDKTLRNYRSVAHILLMFPNATILHVKRGVMDTLFSCLKNRFTSPSMAYALNQDTLAQEFALYRQVMSSLVHVPPLGNILDVEYEQLVSHPEETMQAVLARLGLPWDDAVIGRRGALRLLRQPTFHSILGVMKPIFTDAMGAHEPYADFFSQSLLREATAAEGQKSRSQIEVEAV